MSMRLQAKLKEKLSSHIEEAYVRQQQVVILENVDAEMTFKTTQAFMEHESQQHEYLPCFHMMGQIVEIRGNFPFNVSALYFSDADAQRLQKDVVYYPSPDELAHLIQTGKFYSKYFTVPEVLANNTYVLPCKVNLMVVPPPNEAAYNSAVLQNFVDLEEEQKVNLPLFYIGIVGTGISRKNDKLLDYYGIDLEPGYDQFVLTAQASGYTDPPLLKYMPEPQMQDEQQQETVNDYFITPEEEAQMLQTAQEKQQVAEAEAVRQVVADAQTEYKEATEEDAIIAQADRAISRRMEEEFGSRRLSLDSKRQADKQRSTETEIEAEQEAQSEFLGEEEQTQEEQEVVPEAPVVDASGADVPSATAQVKVNEAEARAVAQGIAVDLQQQAVAGAAEADAHRKASELSSEPQTPENAQRPVIKSLQEKMREARERSEKLKGQQDADIFDPLAEDALVPEFSDEAAEFVGEQETSAVQEAIGAVPQEERESVSEEEVPTDKFAQEMMMGADVTDVAEQVKVDEAHTRDIARDTAESILRDLDKSKDREVPDSMRDIAEKYDQGKEQPESPSDEYI